MRDRGHAVVELALGVGVLLLPAAIVVLSFGPWAERRVDAEAVAAEAARTAVLQASAAVSWQGADVVDLVVEVEPAFVVVTVSGAVKLGLLGAFVDQSEPLLVRASARALPVLLP
jgi:hypothetical protein